MEFLLNNSCSSGLVIGFDVALITFSVSNWAGLAVDAGAGSNRGVGVGGPGRPLKVLESM